jgi:hypothetical protein
LLNPLAPNTPLIPPSMGDSSLLPAVVGEGWNERLLLPFVKRLALSPSVVSSGSNDVLKGEAGRDFRSLG